MGISLRINENLVNTIFTRKSLISSWTTAPGPRCESSLAGFGGPFGLGGTASDALRGRRTWRRRAGAQQRNPRSEEHGAAEARAVVGRGTAGPRAALCAQQ